MDEAPLEIERKFLLDALPDLPPGATAYRMEQGYFPDAVRLRRSVAPDGSIECTHTLKKGTGLVRQEIERTIAEQEFDDLWPRTEGRRLRKTRHRITEAGFTWEIDEYDDIDLVLAEVELPTPDTEAPPPPWLIPHIIREVTDDPDYQNYRLALRGSELE